MSARSLVVHNSKASLDTNGYYQEGILSKEPSAFESQLNIISAGLVVNKVAIIGGSGATGPPVVLAFLGANFGVTGLGRDIPTRRKRHKDGLFSWLFGRATEWPGRRCLDHLNVLPGSTNRHHRRCSGSKRLLDWCFDTPGVLGWNNPNHTATMFDGGDVQFEATNLA